MIGLDGSPLAVADATRRPPECILALLGDSAGRVTAHARPFSLRRAGTGTATGSHSGSPSGSGSNDLAAYHRLREQIFVDEQHLFERSDLDDVDADPRTQVFVAVDRGNEICGGVRLTPLGEGWWAGSRLVVAKRLRASVGVGAALVRAACAAAEESGALRFDASVQVANRRFFEHLGWKAVGPVDVAGVPHVSMRWPIDRAERIVKATKAALAPVLGDLAPGGAGWVGDDGAPVPGSDLVAACDAIMPALVERDPDWAGWCGVLVNINDLAAMGAEPVALLDAVAAPTVVAARRVVAGLTRAARAYGVPIIGGHTQIGVPCALAVTALGRATAPIPAGGGRAGDDVSLTVDTTGGWRPGYRGAQWDSTTGRSSADLRALTATVARNRPAAAKDVSMAGIIGTLGMLAEASGCGAEIDVAAVPRPAGTTLGDWMTCFPGFGMLTADRPGQVARARRRPLSPAKSAVCGRLVPGAGVSLLWPDGERTTAIAGAVTGLGPAGGARAVSPAV